MITAVPGISTLFSTVVIFTGVTILNNRSTVWPAKIVDRRIGTRSWRRHSTGDRRS